MAGYVYGSDIGIPYARLGWVQLNPPKTEDRYDEAFSAKFLIDPESTEVLNKIKVECDRVAQEAFGTVKDVAMPLHDATEVNDDSITAGYYYANAKSWYEPTLVDRTGKRLTDTSMIYSGCYVQAVVRPQAYAVQGKKGVRLNLVAIGFKKDGERLGQQRDTGAIFAGAGLSFETDDAGTQPAPKTAPKPAADTSGGELPFEFGNDTGFDIS